MKTYDNIKIRQNPKELDCSESLSLNPIIEQFKDQSYKFSYKKIT